MSQISTITLRPGTADRILAGHPWIYRGAIQNITQEPADGDMVQVRDHRRRFLGVGLFNAQSKISVRLLSRTKEEIDTRFFLRRLSAAQNHRQRLMPEATAYRLANAEGDELSGLIIDRYEDTCALQISSLGMAQRKPQIIDALKTLCQPDLIIERTDLASRRVEGLSTGTALERVDGHSDPIVPKRLKMNGLTFSVDFHHGHKTGFYLDQQTNYQLASDLAASWGARRILDCFTYQGGFALHLAKRLEGSVLAIDQSQDAIARAEENASLNDLADRCEFKTANVFDWLKEAQRSTRPDSAENKFDAIILDPPSFTRNRNSVRDALRGYKEIHLRALRLLRDRGLLFTYCCSHHVDADTFEEVVATAALDNRRCLRRIAAYGQAPDHPVIPTIPETQYLKGFAYELLPR